MEVSFIGGGNRSIRRKLPTCPKSQEFTPIFSWIRVARSLVFCVVICRSLFVLFSFFYHCVVCPSSIYGFWLYPLGIFKLFSLANTIPLCFIEYISLWSGFKLTILVVIGTDSTGNYNHITIRSRSCPLGFGNVFHFSEFAYHTTTTAPLNVAYSILRRHSTCLIMSQRLYRYTSYKLKKNK